MIPSGVVANVEYSIVELNYIPPPEVYDWLYEQYGPPNGSRWLFRHPTILFANPKDHLMFLLKWG